MISDPDPDLIEEDLRTYLEAHRAHAKALGIGLETELVLALLRETKISNDLAINVMKAVDALMKETHKVHEALEGKKS